MTRLSTYFVLLALALPFRAASQSNAITLGLLLPDSGHSHIVAAAELAIDQANAAGGYMNREFKLLIRSTEGFWGAGSKESVSLVYEDKVRAIIGALDGRNGHLAEQVATKSHLTYIETYATEPTLSQAFVPWFKRMVPNDNQQSDLILDQINKEEAGSIAILSIESYDCRYAVRSLTKALARETGQAPRVINLGATEIHQADVINTILSTKADHLVIPYDAPYLKDLIITLGEEKPNLKIYGTLHFTMGMEKRGADQAAYEGSYMITPNMSGVSLPALPDSHAACMYDAVNLLINAIRKVGCDRIAITDYISQSTFTGLTGKISFDELGNRQEAARLIHIRNGIAQPTNQY